MYGFPMTGISGLFYLAASAVLALFTAGAALVRTSMKK